MKFFISIAAFGNPKDTIEQIEQMYDEKHFYFVHWNKRDLPKKNLKILKNHFKTKNNIIFYSKYKVFWGHVSILNVCIYASNLFLKRNQEDYFINIDNKTVVIKNILDVENYIKKNSNKNFIGLCRKHYEYATKDEINYWELQRKSYIEENSWRKKFLYKLCDFNNNSYFYALMYLIFHSFLFIKNFISTKDIKKSYNNCFFHSKYFTGFWRNCYSKKELKIPKELKNIEWIFMNQIGPFLCINKKDLDIINNSPLFLVMRKFVKKICAPEEIFYPTLFYNLVSSDIKNSICINLSTNWSLPMDKKRLDKIYNNILFTRRVKGKGEIDNFKQVFKDYA